jgi:hypothetical protein
MSIDFYSKQGFQFTSQDPLVRRRLHNGNIIHSSNGASHKNFELIACGRTGIFHNWRQGGERGDFIWNFGAAVTNFPVARQSRCNGDPAVTSTTYTRNFELLYWNDRGYAVHMYYEQSAGHWSSGGGFGSGDISGYPAFIQSNYDTPGNFESVVRHNDGSLRHGWRHDKARSWNPGGIVCRSGVRMSGPSLIQANIGTRGNFYVVAVMDDTNLQLFWRNNDDSSLPWLAGETFGGLVGWTPPIMIQTNYGSTDQN